jgi:hypothetical protein
VPELAEAQQQHWLDARAAVVAAVRRFQRRPCLDQQQADAAGEEAEAVVRGELVSQKVINTVQRSLEGQLGKAHRGSGR